MNCIFCCVFHQYDFLSLFFLLLESIFIYGNLRDDTEILVYTSTSFKEVIQNSSLFDETIIKFEVNDTYNNIDTACKSRLDLFQFGSIVKYDKILYLDIDVLVKDDIHKVFDVCKEDILYALEEGEINLPNNYWGNSLFGNEVENYEDKPAFSSGVMLFNNCEKIRGLFEKIKKDILNRPHICNFHDQPYIVYNAFKYNLINNKALIPLVVNNDHNIHSNKVVHHFPGGPGVCGHKLNYMKIFLFNYKESTISNIINEAKKYINNNLISIIQNSGEPLEGNIFMYHHSLEYTDLYINKVKNISNLLLNKNIKNVLEIGFNSGFSSLLMLLSNPNVRVTCLDLGEHRYTIPCYRNLKSIFGDRINIIIGDSCETLQTVNEKFDLIHIDGGHTTEVAESDIVNCYRNSKNGTILIMDDYDFPNLHMLWDTYIVKYGLKPLNNYVYPSLHHDIKYVTNKFK